MSQRITNGEECTLYDSVTGFSFGPVFANHHIANQFINFAEKCGFENGDIRECPDSQIVDLWSTWSDFCGATVRSKDVIDFLEWLNG